MNVFPGEWDSVYRGEGIEFDSIKPFELGDDPRDIDLTALLQSGDEEVIQRVEGRQMRIFIWADVSGSMQRSDLMFFPAKPEIRDIALGLLVYSAKNVYCPVGLCAFDKEIRRFFPAKFGESQCDTILNWIIDQEYDGITPPADINNALSFLPGKVSRQSMVFFISDFKDRIFEEDFTDILRPIIKIVDFIPVVIRDPLEKDVSLKRAVNIVVKDSEGRGSGEIYLTPQKLRDIQEISAKHLLHLEQNFRQIGIRPLVLDSPQVSDCFQTLSGYFESKKRIKS